MPAPTEETDWQQVAIFGAGVALGIAVGAGAALLAAPRSGAETRAVLSARAGRVGRSTRRRGHDAWDDLREELRGVTRAIRRRKARRAAERDLRREVELEVE
jgi:gas vesicle protein